MARKRIKKTSHLQLNATIEGITTKSIQSALSIYNQ
jgi:hypothetical protein